MVRMLRTPSVAALLLGSLLAAVSAAPSAAQVPSVLPFQTRLVDAGGAPVAPGTAVQATLFDAETAGSAVWGPETHTVAPVNGVVTLFLGDGDTPDPIDPAAFAGGDRFLELVVGGETLSPRFRLGSSGYAMRAEAVVPGAIDGNSIASNAVTAAKIAAAAVGTSEVADNSLTASDLAPNSVGTSEIATGAVTASDLAANAVNTTHVAPNTLSADDLAANSVGASEIASSAVGTSEVADNSLTANDLATNSVGAAEIASNAVGASEIASNAVGSAEIASNAVSDTKISDEPGTAYAATNTDTALVRGSVTSVLSRTINIPTSGFVLATGTANFDLIHNPVVDDSEVLFSVSTSSTTHQGDALTRFLLPITAAPGLYRTSLASTHVFNFTSSGNKTIRILAEAQDGFGISVIDANLSLLFVPTAYGTVSEANPGGEAVRIEE